MINTIWPWLILISISYSFFFGRMDLLNDGIYDSTRSAINLCVTLFGNIALWNGLMRIVRETKIIKVLCKLLSPIIVRLFPETKSDLELRQIISMNMISNFLGLGNAATPIGIKAMKLLNEKNSKKRSMSNSMIMLVLINSASIQLIPTTMLAIRQSLNSKNPNNIIIPVWLATTVAATTGIIALKIFFRKR